MTVAAAENAEAAETASEQHTHEDEERQVGVAQPAASEATPLLPSSDAPSTSRLHAARAFASRYVPRRVARALGLRSHSHHRHSQLAPATGKHQFRRRGTTEAVECAICLCDFEKGDRVTELPCGHLFHESEITPWLLETRRHVSALERLSGFLTDAGPSLTVSHLSRVHHSRLGRGGREQSDSRHCLSRHRITRASPAAPECPSDSCQCRRRLNKRYAVFLCAGSIVVCPSAVGELVEACVVLFPYLLLGSPICC